MRTLTVYVVRHADDAPMSVHPTIKAANEYLAGLAEDNDGEPLCIEWHTEARTFQDNSSGAAQMMSLILSQCAEELIAGMEARRILMDAADLEKPIRDLEVGPSYVAQLQQHLAPWDNIILNSLEQAGLAETEDE